MLYKQWLGKEVVKLVEAYELPNGFISFTNYITRCSWKVNLVTRCIPRCFWEWSYWPRFWLKYIKSWIRFWRFLENITFSACSFGSWLKIMINFIFQSLLLLQLLFKLIVEVFRSQTIEKEKCHGQIA